MMEMEMGKTLNFKSEQQIINQENVITTSATTVDWKGRPSNPTRHGGFKSAAFVLGLQGLEIMGIAAVGNNLITYVIKEMHYPLSKAANIVTNFIGTIFLLSLFGGYLSDSYLGCFWTILIFGFLELSGFILLAVQAHLPQLKPPECNMILSSNTCQEARGMKGFIFFVALYLVALGSGCVKPNMIAHGADQFSPTKHSKQLSTYFNAAYLAFSIGELVALTAIVWVQTHSGMDVGFGISAVVMAMGLVCLVSGSFVYKNKKPSGSILIPIAQVLVAAFVKRKQICPSNVKMLHGGSQHHETTQLPLSNLFHTNRFRFLDKACIKVQESGGVNKEVEGPWRLCTISQVEQVKTLISILPIFGCTIIFNTILAQLQTFSVQQGSQMNTHITKNLTIPPASLQAIPYLILLFLVPLYDKLFVPLLRNYVTGRDSGITPLQRIGAGLFISTFSMVAASIMEYKRRHNFIDHNKTISIFYITPQFIIFGLSEMLTAVGLIEFFYNQGLKNQNGIQSFLMAMTYCSYSFGFYFSSILVSLVNKITCGSSYKLGWLGQNDLNKDRLDLFYWLLGGLSFINFFHYLFWAHWYNNSCSTTSSVMLTSHHQHHHVSPEEFDNDSESMDLHHQQHGHSYKP